MNDNSDELGSISQAIVACGAHDADAAAQIWNRFFDRLCRYVRSRIFQRHRRLFDEEDIANSVFFALFDGLRNDRFENVARRDDLWQLITLIAARKACNAGKQMDRKKRGGGKVRGESAFGERGLESVVDYVEREGATSDFDDLATSSSELIQMLPDNSLRKVVLMRLAGHSVDEIALELNCVSRTVERKLQLIRKIWADG